MDQLQQLDWPHEVITAIKDDDLALFIGNGLSRLSKAPSWGALFDIKSVNDHFNERRIEKSKLTYLECANILERERPGTWKEVLESLKDWSAGAIPSRSHEALRCVLKPSRTKCRLITSNVDSLLTSEGLFKSEEISYCHGTPGKIDTWIFSTDKYWSDSNKAEIKNSFDRIDKRFILFIGYSHSPEDFDIVGVSRYFSDIKRLFSLNSNLDKSIAGFEERIEHQKIKPVFYHIPQDATLAERDVFLSHALLELSRQAGTSATSYKNLRAQCDAAHEGFAQKRRRAAIVLGLTGTNRHLELGHEIPSGGRRFSVKATVRTEIGGPGYIVSKLLQFTGNNCFLVTKIGNDIDGKNIISSINASNTLNNECGRIFTDFIEVSNVSDSPTGFRTWESFILEPGPRELNRVFIDRKIDHSGMKLSDKNMSVVADIIRNKTSKVMYFDKFFKDGIMDILFTMSSDQGFELSHDVWTVYETGSEGDRYSRTEPGASFRIGKAYELERSLSGSNRRINIVAASFRFARDYLAKQLGGFRDTDYRCLLHKYDSAEIIAGMELVETEDDIIKYLVENDVIRDRFVAAVAKGGSKFLREHDLRMIIITLHGHGCLLMAIPTKGKRWFKHIKGEPVSEHRHYNASAGDVFRGVLVAALATAQRNGIDAKSIMDQAFAIRLGQLCNKCAAIKVGKETVEGSLADIQSEFLIWKNTEGYKS